MDIRGKKIYNSPRDWIAEHIQKYIDTNGDEGHEWRPNVYTLLITTEGRKTGKLHRTGLIYGRDKGRYIVVASNGGRPNHPNWYLNLKKNPEAYLQVCGEKFYARASEAEGEERLRLWEMMADIFPQYKEYKEKTDRKIPVIILERIEKQ
jgi:deazaflavin-dependent oxidoreductase (nitroreductase family)